MLLELILFVISLTLIFDYLNKKRRCDITANLKGPKSLPIIGNALNYFNKSPEDIMEYISQNRNKYGPLYKVWIFNQLAVFSSDPKDVEIILSSTKHIQKNTLYDLLYEWLGGGLLLSIGSKWHSRRKIITPTFHFKILEQFVEVFDQQSTILVQKLHTQIDNMNGFNINPYICLAALDTIAETAMGVKVHAQTKSENAYANAVTQITNIMANRFTNVWQRIHWIFCLTAPLQKHKQNQALKVLHSFTERIIEERRQLLEESIANGTYTPLEIGDTEIGTKTRMALLDVLLQASLNGKPLSNEDIREEVDTFMFEGHDTTTSAISFTLYCLSRYPNIQQKVFDEILQVFGSNDKNTPASYRQLQELKYLECVIKETLRLYPPVPMIGRYLTEDVNLNGNIIPAGTNYTVGLFAMFRDPEFFEDPELFIPDRHTLQNTTEQTNPFAYIPFSAGPRNCIGQKFAMLEMKSMLSKILRHYQLLPAEPNLRLMMNLVMRSSNGVHLALKTRIYE